MFATLSALRPVVHARPRYLYTVQKLELTRVRVEGGEALAHSEYPPSSGSGSRHADMRADRADTMRPINQLVDGAGEYVNPDEGHF